MGSNGETQALLSKHEKKKDYPEKGGYVLDPEGLAGMVSQNLVSALDVFDDGEYLSAFSKLVGCPDVRSGLSSSTNVPHQREKYGSNRMPLPAIPSLLALYIEGFKDITIVMLLVSAILSLVLGLGIEKDWEHGWIEGTSIMVTVCLVLSVSAITDYVKAKAFRDQLVTLEANKHVHVIRDQGTSINTLHPQELVVGDILRLAVGDIVPVDGILIDASTDLKMDESALTGETKLIPKAVYTPTKKSTTKNNKIDPFIISGTNVMQGSGKLLVLAVGSRSMQGKILARISQDEDELQANDSKDDDNNNNNTGICAGFFTFQSLSEEGAADDLMGKLDTLAVDIGKVGLIVAGVVFLVMVVSWSIAEFEDPSRHWDWGNDLNTVLDFFITAITILVVAVPEGLPLAVTLALAISMNRMMKDQNQVKHMDACETMGSATTICSDKTGTLTENKMTVMRLQMGMETSYEHVVGSNSKSLGDCILQRTNNQTFLTLLTESIVLNCNPTSKVTTLDDQVKYEGNATECALLKLILQLGSCRPDIPTFRNSYKDKESSTALDWGSCAFPFSSEKKRMSWIVPQQNSTLPYRLYSKGAPQQLLDSCSTFVTHIDDNHKIHTKALTSQEKKNFQTVVNNYQTDGLRSLILAYRDFSSRQEWEGNEKVDETNLTLLAVIGIEDPLRASVPSAIDDCRKAGIDVRMCTGDALVTGIAIAKGCQILRPCDFVKQNGTLVPKKNFAMTGAELDDLVHKKDTSQPHILRRVYDPTIQDSVHKLAPPFLLDAHGNKVLDQQVFDEIWPTLRVLARCQPEDKLTLVQGMRKSKIFLNTSYCEELYRQHKIKIFPDYQVVAVTGDGTNDAPALKSANVGFAMGIVGTETAKQACDIILMDDNFSSIVKAVLWGRNIFDSISKFLQFQLTVNVVAITLAVIGAFCYAESPLTAVQMLWVNMIMDSLASLALATELPTQELLERKPYGKHRPVISNIMYSNILGHSLYQIAILCWVLFAPHTIPFLQPTIEYEPKQGSLHWTFFFNVFVLLQLFNEFNSRHLQTLEKLKTTYSEWNVFLGVTSNKIFVLIMVTTFVLQVIIVQYGGLAVNLAQGGLTVHQWMVCIVMGAFSWVWQIMINIFITVTFDSIKEEQQEVEKSIRFESIRSSMSSFRGDNSVVDETGKILPKRSARSNWSKVQVGVRQGNVYSKALNLSFRSGVKLHKLIKTKANATDDDTIHLRASHRVSARDSE